MMTLECPTCQASVLSDDRFCESCGTPLKTTASPVPAHAQAISGQTIAGQTSVGQTSVGCQKCGAPVGSIDADGYCDQCGFRNLATRVAQEFDHIVVTLSPILAGVSDRGISHHQNEDFFAIGDHPQGQVMVVCDGVSSSTAPQTASQSAAQTACQTLTASLSSETIRAQTIQTAIQTAQSAVANLVDADHEDPPSTTIVAAVIQQGIATIGWVGDSRAYWISTAATEAASSNQVLTTDHSWFNDQVASGNLSAAEAHRDPKAHAITRWLGADADAEPAQTLSFAIPGPGYLVLCSDGLWNYLSDPDHLATLINPHLEAATIGQRLVDYANAKGGRDNITVALLIMK